MKMLLNEKMSKFVNFFMHSFQNIAHLLRRFLCATFERGGGERESVFHYLGGPMTIFCIRYINN